MVGGDSAWPAASYAAAEKSVDSAVRFNELWSTSLDAEGEVDD